MTCAIILTDGKAGHENQSRAFARALGCEAEVVPVAFKSRLAKALSYLLDNLGVRTLKLLSFNGQTPKPKDGKTIVIGTGSGTFYAAKALAKLIGAKCGVVLTPSGYDLRSFDCILAPEFDNPPSLPNIVKIPVNLVANDDAFYAKGVAAFNEHYATGKDGQTPSVAVVIGGPNKCSSMSAEWMKRELSQIFSDTADCEHWVTTSRRTPPDVEAVVDSFPFDYKLIYSRDHFNPIPAFVKLAKRLYVTAESTGMISEACSFGSAEVRVLDNLNPGPHKFRRFVDGLAAAGYIGGSRKVDLSSQFAAARRLLGL